MFFFSSRRRHTRCALVTGVQTCALPICRVSEVNAGDIERFFRDVEAGKTARDDKIGPRRRIVVRGGAGAARKVFRDLSAVFSFARRREIVTRNPCETAAVKKTDNHKERFLDRKSTRLNSSH